MKDSNLEVWTIQNDPKEIESAFENIKKTSKQNILFRGCNSTLKLGRREIKVYFDTAFYSEENDMVIFLMKDGNISGKELKEMLKQKKIPCSDIVLDIYKEQEREENAPPILFVRESQELENILKESKENGMDFCTYYPNLEGSFSFHCYTSPTTRRKIDGRKIKGVITLEDKMILLINQGEKRNVSMQKAIRILIDSKMNTMVDMKGEPLLSERSKQYRKEL